MVFVHHTKDLKFPHFKIRRTKSSNSCLRSRNTRYNKLGKKLYTKIGKPRIEALVNKHKYTTTKKKKKKNRRLNFNFQSLHITCLHIKKNQIFLINYFKQKILIFVARNPIVNISIKWLHDYFNKFEMAVEHCDLPALHVLSTLV